MDTLLFHPKVVHLPIALGLLMPLIAGALLLAWWKTWLPGRVWVLAIALQGLLVLSSVAALRSGEAEEERVEAVVAESVIEKHEEAAELFLWASVATFALMLVALPLAKTRVGKSAALVATLATLAVLGLGYRTGQLGGSLVYKHGAAQVYLGAQPSVSSPAASPATDD